MRYSIYDMIVLWSYTCLDRAVWNKRLVYPRQQNILYPRGVRLSKNIFLKILVSSQAIVIEEKFSICGRRGWQQKIKEMKDIFLSKSATFGGKEYFAANGTMRSISPSIK